MILCFYWFEPEYHSIHLVWHSIRNRCESWTSSHISSDDYEADFDSPEEPSSFADCYNFYFYDNFNRRMSEADCEKIVQKKLFPPTTRPKTTRKITTSTTTTTTTKTTTTSTITTTKTTTTTTSTTKHKTLRKTTTEYPATITKMTIPNKKV